MTDNWVLTILTFVFGVGGPLGVYVMVRKELRQSPIDYNTAQVADAVAISSAARGLVDTFSMRLSIQDAKLAAQDDKIAEQNKRIDSWDDWYSDLSYRWDFHKLKPAPPPPPQTSNTYMNGVQDDR